MFTIEPIVPMEPKSSSSIPDGKDWIAQVKWDGVRVLTYFDGKQVRLFNRKMNERTLHYPELRNIRTYCKAKSVVLDGEIIALGDDGKPSFHEVMKRDGVRNIEKIEWACKSTPITYMIFDLIYYDGIWIHSWPLNKRIQLLPEIILPNERVQLVSSHEELEALFSVIKEQNMEGIVVKRLDSEYVIGGKKDVWLKIKNYQDLIAVIGGYTLRNGVVNAVLLGLYNEHREFVYIGHAGTGKLSHQEWRALTEIVKPLTVDTNPFRNMPGRHDDAYWVIPKKTVRIQFMEWTEGMALRQPSIQAFVDQPPLTCTLP